MFTGVCLSTGGGCMVQWGGAWLGGAWSWGGAWSRRGALSWEVHGPGGGGMHGPQGGVWSWGGVCFWGGSAPRGVPGGDTPPMATAAGGTHLTGMHSCSFFVFQFRNDVLFVCDIRILV